MMSLSLPVSTMSTGSEVRVLALLLNASGVVLLPMGLTVIS